MMADSQIRIALRSAPHVTILKKPPTQYYAECANCRACRMTSEEYQVEKFIEVHKFCNGVIE